MNLSSSLRAGALVCAALLLGGCATSTDNAAVVGKSTVSVDDVNVVSEALCAERAAMPADQNPGYLAVSQVKAQALQALVDAELTAQFTKNAPYNPAELNAQLKNVEPLITRLPTDEQGDARALISKIFVGQIRLADIGRNTLGLAAAGQQPQQLLAVGLKQRADFDKATKVDVNPRYATAKDTGNSSISRGVSTVAKGAYGGQQNEDFVGNLPANQKCGP